MSTINDDEHSTVYAVRCLGSGLNAMSDEQIADLYRIWSEEEHAAGWYSHSYQSLRDFVEWATTAPKDRK